MNTQSDNSTSKGKDKASEEEAVVEVKNTFPRPDPPTLVGPSLFDDPERAQARPSMPRSKSQLTMMIAQDRRASESTAEGKQREKQRKTST